MQSQKSVGKGYMVTNMRFLIKILRLTFAYIYIHAFTFAPLQRMPQAIRVGSNLTCPILFLQDSRPEIPHPRPHAKQRGVE